MEVAMQGPMGTGQGDRSGGIEINDPVDDKVDDWVEEERATDSDANKLDVWGDKQQGADEPLYGCRGILSVRRRRKRLVAGGV